MAFLAKGKVNRGSSCNSNRLRTLNRIVGPGARPARAVCYSSAYLAFNIAEKRAALVFRRFLALGFSKRRCRRTCCRVCSRSSFFLKRRSAFSTGSPFFSLISVILILKTFLMFPLFLKPIELRSRPNHVRDCVPAINNASGGRDG